MVVVGAGVFVWVGAVVLVVVVVVCGRLGDVALRFKVLEGDEASSGRGVSAVDMVAWFPWCGGVACSMTAG